MTSLCLLALLLVPGWLAVRCFTSPLFWEFVGFVLVVGLIGAALLQLA